MFSLGRSEMSGPSIGLYLYLSFCTQGSLFEEIAQGLRHAKVMVVCVSDEVRYYNMCDARNKIYEGYYF